MNEVNKTALSYWFPLIEAAGLPVPKTKIIRMPEKAQANIWAAFDGKEGNESDEDFYKELADAAMSLNLPCFLRTDMTSAKHQWERTCYLSSIEKLRYNVFEIAEFSACCDLMGIPWDTWVVREFLPTIQLGKCQRYGNMPVCREFRVFVDSGNVRCWHPYWPLDSLKQGKVSDLDYESLCVTEDINFLHDLAREAGLAVGGSWSIDILETKRGWYVTDMAEAHKSFHWEGCEK